MVEMMVARTLGEDVPEMNHIHFLIPLVLWTATDNVDDSINDRHQVCNR
jgi:hypothetical protein